MHVRVQFSEPPQDFHVLWSWYLILYSANSVENCSFICLLLLLTRSFNVDGDGRICIHLSSVLYCSSKLQG